MRRAKRNAAKLLSAAMAVGMMAGMAVPAAAEEESKNIWASDVDTSAKCNSLLIVAPA